MQQLCIGCLVQSDSEWQVDAHDPELRGAGEMAVEDVGQQTQDPIDMKQGDSTNCQWYRSDAKKG